MKNLYGRNSLHVADLLIGTVILVVPFHAFLTVWASSLVGHFTLLRLWNEILLSALLVAILSILLNDTNLRNQVFSNKLIRLVAVYGALTIVFGLIALAHHQVGLKALGYGLIIDLRYLVWFVCVWIVSQRTTWLRNNWQKLVLLPLVFVIIFGLLQFFILPNNFLSHFGYGKNTFVPYITINQDTNTIRIQSFLRGANPLGAYLAAMTAVIFGLVDFIRSKKSAYLWIVFLGTLATLFLSFSRSGIIGAFVAVVVGVGIKLRTKKQKKVGIVCILLALAAMSVGYISLQHNPSVQNAVLHVSSYSTAKQTSNEGHLASLLQSLRAISRQPLGQGVGTAGQASWYNTGHPVRNTESYFLQIGEETGWLGLTVFLAILAVTGRELWIRRDNPLALGLLAGLVGLIFVAQFSYAWSDDTLAFVWWGLVGIALSSPTSKNITAQK